MEKDSLDDRQSIPLAFRAEQALKEAVAEAIAAHTRAGVPIAVWRNGKVSKVHASMALISARLKMEAKK